MPELQQQDVDQSESTTGSRSTSRLAIQYGQTGARRPARTASAKYYNIATSILSNDIDDLFLGAARDGEYEKIEHILQRRNDVVVSIDVKDKRTGNTPLMWAAKKGHSKIVQILLKHGADPTLHNYEDLSALEMATSNIKTILLDSVEKTTELSHRLLLQASWQGNIKVIRKLLSQNKVLDINCQNAEGLSPLLLVARDIQLFERLSVQLNRHYNPIDVAVELLKHRADIHMTDNNGKTSLHYVCLSRAMVAKELVQNLITSGSALEVRDKRFFTPIHLASHSGNHNVITALLHGGSEVNCRGFLGLTPLHITSQQDHQRAAMILLENGADVTIVDDQGKSPVDLAKSRKMRTTLKEAWTEATQKKISPTLAPVRAPSRDDSKGQSSKRRKGEVIFDGHVVPSPSQSSRPTVSRSTTCLSNSDKARKAEEQMMKDIENGTFTHMPNVKEGMKRLNAMRTVKSTSFPNMSSSSPSNERLSPESSSQGGDNLRSSPEDGRNLINSPRLPVTCLPKFGQGTLSSSVEDLELCLYSNRLPLASSVENGKKLKTHHRSGSDPFSSPSYSDLTVSYDNIISARRGRNLSDSSATNEDVDDASHSRLLRTPLDRDRDREISILNIPKTIPESMQNTRVIYPDNSSRRQTNRIVTASSTFITQKSYSFLDAKLIDTEREGKQSKESSPRSDEEIGLSRSGSLRLSLANPSELLRSRSLFKDEFILEESRPRDSMVQSSGSDPLSSASSMSSSPREGNSKHGLSVSSKLPGIDGRVNSISNGGKSSVKRSQSFTQGQRLRTSNQIQDSTLVQHQSTDKMSKDSDSENTKSFKRDKILQPLETNTTNNMEENLNVSVNIKNDKPIVTSKNVNTVKPNVSIAVNQNTKTGNKISNKNVEVVNRNGKCETDKNKNEGGVNFNANANMIEKQIVSSSAVAEETSKEIVKPNSKDFKVSFSSMSPQFVVDSSPGMNVRSPSAISSKSVNSGVSLTSTNFNSAESVKSSGHVNQTSTAKSGGLSGVSGKIVKNTKNENKNVESVAVAESVQGQTQIIKNNNSNRNSENNSSAKTNTSSSKSSAFESKKSNNSQKQTSKPQSISKKDSTSILSAKATKNNFPNSNRTATKKVTSASSLKIMTLGIKSSTAKVADVSQGSGVNKTIPVKLSTDVNAALISQNLTNIENLQHCSNQPTSATSNSSSKYRVVSAKCQNKVPEPKKSDSLPKSSCQNQLVSKSFNLPKSSASMSQRKNSARSCAVSGIQVSLVECGTPTPGRQLHSKTESNLGEQHIFDLKHSASESQISKPKMKTSSRKFSEPKEPLVRISVQGEEPKVNLSQKNMAEFLAEMHTPVIVNPFENLVPYQHSEVEQPNYIIAKTAREATVKTKPISKARTVKSARKPKTPSSATVRQTSAGKKKGGKVKSVKTNSEDVRPKSVRVPKRGRSAKKVKKGTALSELAAKADVALISGIGWQLATGCLDNTDVKAAKFTGSDSDVSNIYDDDVDLKTERDLSPSPCHSPLNLIMTPRFCEVRYEEDMTPLPVMSHDGIPPTIIREITPESSEDFADFNSDEYNVITANLHREILRNKMTPILESPGNSLVSTVTKQSSNHDKLTLDEKPNKIDSVIKKSAKSEISDRSQTDIQGHIRSTHSESQTQLQDINAYYHDNIEHSVSPDDENIDTVIDEILNFNSSALNSTLRSNKSVCSANSTLTEVDVKLLQELRKPVKGFHANTVDDDNDSVAEDTSPRIKITKQQESSIVKADAEAKEIAKVVRTFGHLELHAGGSVRSGGKESSRRDLSSLQQYGGSYSISSANRKPSSRRSSSPCGKGSGRFHELKFDSHEENLTEYNKDSNHSSYKMSPEDAALEQLQEVVGAESIAQSLANVIKDGGMDTGQTVNRLSFRRGSGCSSACTTDSLASTIDEMIQWKKGNVLGKGAFGTVWCGLTNEGELIAVKQIELNSMDIEKAHREYEKVQEEVELLKNLKHKNIVGYLGTSFEDSIVSIFMQFVPGGSLASILARFGALDESVFRRYTRQILEGVEYLHENEVIHRDIKGGNVMLMPNGIIKLIDFGCAKRLCFNLSMSQSQILKSMKGTPYWMAPEVVSETGHGKKSDIWSIGCTVFEMATRKPPWSHMNPMAAIFAIGSDRPVPQLSETFSVLARQFVNACLTRDQATRPTATDLLSHPFILKKPPSRK